MNARWALTICCNLLLLGALCRCRPKDFRWLWASQSFVMLATSWNVWAWYHLSDAAYNAVWWRLDVTQAWFEMMVILELVGNYAITCSGYDAAALLALCMHLEPWLLEYWHWDDILNMEGSELFITRKTVNIAAILALCVSVYYRAMRDRAKEKQVSHDEHKKHDHKHCEEEEPVEGGVTTNSEPGDGDDDGSGPKGDGSGSHG